jgi:mannose-6-phosphate isomerase-like protein (cupin superfamily)
MAKEQTRRDFLWTAPLAAAVTISLTDKLAFAAAGAAAAPPPEPFQLFTAQSIQDAITTLHAAPGNKNLVDAKTLPFTVVLTVEEKKSAKEFEWHEGRDHIVQILEGSTHYEVGGTPKDGHNTKPGEWLAPASEGATSMTLKKGDMLTIPRGTPHKRSTEGSVTLILISTTGTPAA